jgi:hypothetical protein
MPKVWIIDLEIWGEVISPGFAASLVGYNDMGVRYEVYMDNEDFIERDGEITDDSV